MLSVFYSIYLPCYIIDIQMYCPIDYPFKLSSVKYYDSVD